MASMLEAKPEEEAVKKYRRAVVEEFNSQFAAISSVLEGSMQKFVEKAFAARLISETVMKSKEFSMIATDFKAGLKFKDTVLDIQHYCQSFIEILEDLGGPAVDVANHLYIRWSVGKFLTTSGIQNSEHLVFHEETNKILDLMTDKIEQIPNLAKIAYHLQKSFAILCISVKEVLKTSSVHLNDAKLFIRVLLHSKVRLKLEAFHECLQSITSFDNFFVFLNNHHFVGYLNYDVLKALAGLAKNEDINKQIGEYEKEYAKFLQDASFSDILSIFSQYPDLKPAAVIGFPYDPVGFHLDSQRWSLKKICYWIISFGGICGSGGYQLDDTTDSSVLITYVIFPSALPYVLRDLSNPVILQKFEDIGVTVQLPDSIRDYLSEDLSPLCMLPGEVSDTSVLRHDDEVEELAPLTLTGTLDPTTQILQRHLKALSQLVLSVETVQLLYTEGVISKDILDKVEKLGGSIANDPLSSICRTVSKDQKQLKVFASVLLHSKKTVPIATVLLKEYEKNVQMSIFPSQRQITEDTISSLEKTVPSVATFAEKGHVGQVILKEYDENFSQVQVWPSQPDISALDTTSTSINQSTITELYLPPTFQYDFDRMRTELRCLVHSVAPLIKSSEPPLSQQEFSFPLKELKKYLKRCFRELKPQLSIAESFDDVMDIVEEKCTIINVACLEAVIDHYNIKEAKDHIAAYKSALEKFCEDVKLSVLSSENFMIGSSSLLKCETIEFILEWKADEHTLSEIQDLLWKAFGDMAKRVLVTKVREDNSIIVTCYAPRHVMDILQMEGEKNLDLLIKLGLLKLTMGYHVIWDMCKREKEVKALEEKVISEEIRKPKSSPKEPIKELKSVPENKQKELEKQREMIKNKSKTAENEQLCKEIDSQVPSLNDNWNADLQSPPVQTVTSNFSIHKKSDQEWYSPSFLSHPNGYEMCLRIIANGQYEGYGTHLSLYIHLMAGKNDDNLSWPFRGEVKVQLVNHKGNNVELGIFFQDQACNRVINGILVKGGLVNRVGQGRVLFISYDKLQASKFLRDNSIRVLIKDVIVYAAPLPEIAPSAVLDFVITNFSKRKISNEECTSQSFYSHENGYKLSLMVYPNGRDKCKNKCISIFVHLMKGENDDKLTFPFRGDILVQIVNWRENKNHAERLVEFNKETDPRGYYGARVTGLSGLIWLLSGRQYQGYGFPDFLSHNFLQFDESLNTQYVSDDDSVHVRVTKITLA